MTINKISNELIKKNILFGILYISFSAPSVFFIGGLPMILQIEGIDASLIGLFQIIGLPAVLKFFISLPIDKIVFEKNHYKKWLISMGILYSILLFCISFLSLKDNLYLVLLAIIISTLISTVIDISLNALSIKVFSKDERIIASGYKTSAYFASGILGSGIFLLLYNHIGWDNTFIIISLIVLVSLITLFFIKESDEKIEEKKVSFKTILSFFKQKDIGIWVFILAFYFAFILAVWIFMKPYLISKGISADDVAIYVGIYGSIVGLISGLIASFIGSYLAKKTILIYFGIFNMLSIFILIIMEFYQFTFILFIISVTFTSLSMALSFTIIFSMMMDYARENSRGIDYAVQSSISSFVRILSAIIAGFIVSVGGFGAMFIVEFIGMGLVVFVIYKFYND